MHNTISTHRSLPNLSNTSVTGETSKNALPSVSELHDDSVPTSNPEIISTEVSKKTTSPSPLQIEYRQQNAAPDGERSNQRPSLSRLPSFLRPLLGRKFSLQNLNSGRGVEADTTIVRIDDVPPPTPATPAAPSPSSWLTRSSLLRKTGIVLGETINHFTVAAIVWGTISPLINQANGSNSVDGGDYKGNYRIAALNVLAMIPISFVLTNTLFAILRGVMGYQIEKTELEEAFSEPGFVARLKSAQKDTDYNGAIADVLYSSVFGAGMVGGSQLPMSKWVKEAGLSLSENNQQIVNSAMQIAIAAAALALVRTSLKLSRNVDGIPTYQIKSLGHHNPIKNLAGQFKAMTEMKRKDEPSNISQNYRAIRNLALRMLEEASVWGGSTLYSAGTGISTRASRDGASNSVMQFLNGYMTVTLGYFFDEGNSLNKVRINEDFSPWKFLGAWGATKEFFLPDLPPPSSTIRALDESAGMATVAQSMAKDIGNIGERLLHAKNVATVYGPRIFLDAATSVEHTLLKWLAHAQQSRTNQTSSVQIEEIGSLELVQTQNPSAPLQTGNEEAISHIVEITPADTHDNPASPIEEIDSSEAAQTQNSPAPLQAGNEEAIPHIVEVAPLLAHYRQRSTDQQQQEVVDFAVGSETQTVESTGIVEAAPLLAHYRQRSTDQQQQEAVDLAIGNETQTVESTNQSIAALQAGEETVHGRIG